jgi:hypothetical protein
LATSTFSFTTLLASPLGSRRVESKNLAHGLSRPSMRSRRIMAATAAVDMPHFLNPVATKTREAPGPAEPMNGTPSAGM